MTVIDILVKKGVQTKKIDGGIIVAGECTYIRDHGESLQVTIGVKETSKMRRLILLAIEDYLNDQMRMRNG